METIVKKKKLSKDMHIKAQVFWALDRNWMLHIVLHTQLKHTATEIRQQKLLYIFHISST